MWCFITIPKLSASFTDSSIRQFSEAIKTSQEKGWMEALTFLKELIQLQIFTQSPCPCVYVCPLLFSLRHGVLAVMKHVWGCNPAGWQQWLYHFIFSQLWGMCIQHLSSHLSGKLPRAYISSRHQLQVTAVWSPPCFLFFFLPFPFDRLVVGSFFLDTISLLVHCKINYKWRGIRVF